MSIALRVEDKIAWVSLSRPERRNAFDTAMLDRFEAIIAELSRARDIEVAVLSGQGPSFCAGTDLAELSGMSAADMLHLQRQTGEVVERWARLDLTTITAYNGPAIGSGAVIGLASDLRIAARGTFFSFPEVAMGIPLTWSGIPLLSALLGPDRTKRLLLLGEKLADEELLRLDLISELVPSEKLEAATSLLVDKVLQTPHLARVMTKRAVAAAWTSPGFAAGAFEPQLAALSLAFRGDAPFARKKDEGR